MGKEWRCAMCNITLEAAVKKQKDPLTMDVDDFLNDDATDAKLNQYKWQRTCKNPKRTCGKICGYNYSSWRQTLDDKRTYTNAIFDCAKCGKTSEGGRVKIRNGEKVRICRRCSRKEMINDARRMWEVLNPDWRKDYIKKWRAEHKFKQWVYRRRYLKKQGAPYVGRRRNKAWSYEYDACVRCGDTRLKHRGHGMCRTCYDQVIYQGSDW